MPLSSGFFPSFEEQPETKSLHDLKSKEDSEGAESLASDNMEAFEPNSFSDMVCTTLDFRVP